MTTPAPAASAPAAASSSKTASAAAAVNPDWDAIGDMEKAKGGFENYSKFGERGTVVHNTITLKNADKWLKEAQIFGKTITTTDTSIAFKQVVGTSSKAMTYDQFKAFLWKLALRESKEPAKEAQAKLAALCAKLAAKGEPSTANTTHAVKSTVLERLTDTSKYTGSHKERFDESGKGRGKDGRVTPPDTGYVQGFKDKDTYDETHHTSETTTSTSSHEAKK